MLPVRPASEFTLPPTMNCPVRVSLHLHADVLERVVEFVRQHFHRRRVLRVEDAQPGQPHAGVFELRVLEKLPGPQVELVEDHAVLGDLVALDDDAAHAVRLAAVVEHVVVDLHQPRLSGPRTTAPRPRPSTRGRRSSRGCGAGRPGQCGGRTVRPASVRTAVRASRSANDLFPSICRRRRGTACPRRCGTRW